MLRAGLNDGGNLVSPSDMRVSASLPRQLEEGISRLDHQIPSPFFSLFSCGNLAPSIPKLESLLALDRAHMMVSDLL